MRYTDASDVALLKQIEHGDQDAFLTLYRRYANLVYSMALKVLKNPQWAEDVTQDVFLKLWQKGALYNPNRGKFSTWLLSVTRFAAIDRLRYEGRRVTVESDAHEGPYAEETRTAKIDHALWERGQQLRMLVEQLPPEQRQVLELAYFGGLTHKEMAEQLNLPLGTVKSRLRLGLEKLRSMWLEGER